MHARLLFVSFTTLILALSFAAAAAVAPARAASEARWCSGAATWAQARSRVGRVVKVKARVAGVFYARGSSGRPTFIDLGRRYPDSGRLTLVIWGRSRAQFPSAPERMFSAGRTVCARGRVSTYRGVPQIQLSRWNAPARMIVA